MATGAANPLTASQISNYLSPYTQNVVDATQAQFNSQNAQQQAALTGNTIAQGALGGNRQGIAQSTLAGQQQLAQAPVIAGLYNQGYNQAVQTAAQQYQQNPLAAASSLANFGISGQNAALSGANAQLGAGTLQQQTQQTQDQALYQQYLQQQAYPFQTAQYYANIAGPIAGALGTTSNGTTTAPAPNQTAQYLGLGLAGLSLFSDERVKENIERIGKADNGQTIYRFNYKGSPVTQIGFLAQEVEKKNPDAVGEVNGVKTVDYDAATRANGGLVSRDSGGGVGSTPYAGVVGYVPITQSLGARMASAAGFPQAAQIPQSQSPNLTGIAGLKGSSGLFSGPAYGGGNIFTDAYGGSSSNPLEGLTAADYGEGFARGGGVAGLRGYADGGVPVDATFDDRWNERIAGVSPSRAVDVINPDEPYRMPDQAAVDQWRQDTPVVTPSGAPVVAKDDDESLPANAQPTAGVAGLARPVVAPVQPFSRDDAQAGFGTAPSGNNQSSFGLGYLSPNIQHALLAAGLGMLSSRSPFLGNAIGEGGLAGLNAYGADQAADLKARQDAIKQQQDNRRIEMEAQRLQQEAQRTADDFALRAAGQKETARHNLATENKEDKPPPGYSRNKDNTLSFIKGGPHDPDVIAAETAARTKKGAELDDDTVDAVANRVAQGDTRALIGLGRNPTAVAQVQKRVAELYKEQGLDHEAGAKAILANIADQAGRQNAERTQAGIAAKLAVYGRNVDNAIGVATKASEDANRTQFTPVNKAINAWKTNSGDPKIVALGQALNTLTNEYARAIGSGHGTVHDKEQAEQQLNQARSHEQLVAIMDIMRKEIQMTKKSMPEAREEMRELYSRPSSERMVPGAVQPATPYAPQSATPKRVIQNGHVYELDASGHYQPVQP